MARDETIKVRPIALGHNDNRNQALLEDGETPDDLNVDYNRDSVAAAGGSVKFNNQTAPRPGILTGIAAGDAVLPVLPGKSAPVRGAVYLPYAESQDIGARSAFDIQTSVAVPFNRNWHRQRGRSFDIQQSFQLPEDTRLFPPETRGQLTSVAAGAPFDMRFGFDQALDEFTAVVQKGGDRVPMSWAIGVVNTGRLFDIDVGGGLNVFGVSTATYAARQSNYALCFMWLDAPAWGIRRPVQARYRLTNGSVWSDEGAHVAASDGAYSTLAYRSFIVPVFVEPGVPYHVALRLAIDSGTTGTAYDAVTGELSGVAWNSDGLIELRVQRDFDAVQTFSSSDSATTGIFRYKGPDDSLSYFRRYGIRWFGRDPLHVGLGYRYWPWSSAGFVPFGIDSAPVENGGFAITDLSAHGPLVASTYAEYRNPEEEASAANVQTLLYDLRIEHDPVTDPTGTLFGVSEQGLVFRSFAGHTWGNETAVWQNVMAQGKNPWAPYNVPWGGLGGAHASGAGYNPQALKSYRLVFAQDNAGFNAPGTDACGGMISIDSYLQTGVGGGFTFGQHITAEGGDQFLAAGNPTLAAGAGKWLVLIRAFRWNQRPTIVSELRIYSKPRAWDLRSDFSLSHEIDVRRTGEPGLSDLVACWTFTDGGGAVLRELVAGNHGYLTPMAAPRDPEGGVFLSGEGEAPFCDLAENPDFREQLKAALGDGTCGIAIQMKMRLTEAVYGMTQRQNNEGGAGGASGYYASKFAPPLAVWDFRDTDRQSDLSGSSNSLQIDHVGGRFQRPQPILEFGHNVSVINAVGEEPFLYPLGFTLRVPHNNAQDEKSATYGVPGTVGNGLHAWHRPAGANVSRWSTDAGWVGRDVIVQFGLEPTGNVDEYRAYIAAWPKEFFLPAANDPASSEFAYFTLAETVLRREVERSALVIGGAWNPRLGDYRERTVTDSFLSFGRSVSECNARMIVRDVRVFPVAASGALPPVTGAIVAQGMGKIVGQNALPARTLTADDILRPLSPNGTSVNLTEGSRSVAAASSTSFPVAQARDSIRAVAKTLLAVQGDKASIAVVGTTAKEWQKTYLITAATPTALTLNRPFVGPTRRAAAAVSLRLAAYTAFEDEDRPFTVGKGVGYDLARVTTRDVQITEDAFENIVPLGFNWRWRVYSAIPSGRPQQVLPRWVRGLKRSTWNSIRGLHSLNRKLYAGAQGSLYDVDDRWRQEGPTDSYTRALALRGKPGSSFPLQADRVIFPDLANLNLTSNFLIQGGASFFAFWDFWVKLDEYGAFGTVYWCGSPSTDPSKIAGQHGLEFWVRTADGYPELVLGSSELSAGVAPDRGMFIARGTARLPLDEWTHVRWLCEGTIGSPNSCGFPFLWINGKLTPTLRNAQGDGAAAGTWLTLANIQFSSSYVLSLGAARAAESEPLSLQVVTAAQSMAKIPMRASRTQGWLHPLHGEVSGMVIGRAVKTGLALGFTTTDNFDPRAINYDQGSTVVRRRFSTLELGMSNYGVGHKLLDNARTQWGTIYSHPCVSITHEMGSSDAQFSFANHANEVFVANGGRVVVIEDGEARFAGLQGPRTQPKIDVVRVPRWKPNFFNPSGDPDNDPIFNLSADKTAPPPSSVTPAVVEKVFHYNNPGTGFLKQTSDPTMLWAVDEFFAFKCYFRMRSVSGRINLFSRRSSLDNGGPFLEIRDGAVYAGWYDVALKREVFVRTDHPIVEPGYVYYCYYRKWFPRAGFNIGGNAQYTSFSSNWLNSIHNNLIVNPAYDSLVIRRMPRVAQTGYFDFTGYDLKSLDKDTTPSASWPGEGGANYGYLAAGTTPRACVSFTAADSTFTLDPYGAATPLGWSVTGIVAFNLALDAVLAGDNNGYVKIANASPIKFLADHVGMLLEVSGGVLNGQPFRIVEFVSAHVVRCITQVGTAAGFGVLNGATDTVTVATGTALVKSDQYDVSTTPDNGSYDIELFGSSLQANPLNGVTPFNGEVWGFAYGIFPGDAAVFDGGGNKVALPNIFEDFVGGSIGTTMACGVEVGTDLFGQQGTANTMAGQLPLQGTPLGELQVDLTFAHTAVDTRVFNDRAPPYTITATPPSSTQPNAAQELAQDASATSTAKPTWITTNPVTPGKRISRIGFFDPLNNVQSPLGSQQVVNIAVEDVNNPSAAVSLLYSNLPVCPDNRRTSTLIYLSEAGQADPFLRARVDDDTPDSIGVTIDDVTATLLEPVDETLLGVPPNALYVAASQARMCYANLPEQANGVAFSLAFFPEIVPPANVFPVNTGRSEITAIREFAGALVVFKRDVLLPYIFGQDDSVSLARIVHGDGCVSNASICALEDRLYYLSDRGPQVLVGDINSSWQPFYVGKRVSNYFTDELDRRFLPQLQGAINRRRSQFVFTVRSLGRSKMDERFAMEFQHPSRGEDTDRAEMIAGHRFGRYEGPSCTSLGQMEPLDGGTPYLVGGTDHGFIVWLDRPDTRMALMGPAGNAGVGGQRFGDRTLSKGASFFTGAPDRELEGQMGCVMRCWSTATGEVGFYVLFSALIGSDLNVWLEGPYQESMTAFAAFATGTVAALGSARARWSTKAFDADSPHLDKTLYFLDVTRRITAGELKVDCFRNHGAAVLPGDAVADLSVAFSSIPVQAIVQKARAFRFLFRTQSPAVDVDFELVDLVIRYQNTDIR